MQPSARAVFDQAQARQAASVAPRVPVALTDEAIVAYAQSHAQAFPAVIVTVSGHGRAVALVFAVEGVEHAEYFVLDPAIEATAYGVAIAAFFNDSRRPGEPARQFIRALVMPQGVAGTHVFGRLAASSEEGELFRCRGCGLTLAGRTDMSGGAAGQPSQGHAPYRVSPTEKTRRRFYGPCASV
jgi:hypothetical protein